ncbi:MAG: NAD(P)H-hydrate dehydratase, partial [Victivallales bacterium]|nr:NAD(P)H-hydrate dehydratase [Victivallales bacterium]
MKAITVKQMRDLDRRTIDEAGIPGYALMERAGFACGEKIIEFIEDRIDFRHVKRFVILSGKGNNGGDAYVVARYLYENTDIEIVIYSVCELEKLGEDSSKHAGMIISSVNFSVKKKLAKTDFKKGDIIIDGLLGTGTTGSLRKPYDNWIKSVNDTSLTVIALDNPSGLNVDTGEIEDDCIMSDMTVTVGLPKTGLISGMGPEYCGLLRCAEIGIPEAYVDVTESSTEVFFEADAAKFLSRLPLKSYKNTVGSVLIIGGSKDYYGAPFLAALAAQRAGAGMVYVAVPQAVSRIPDITLSLIVAKVKDNGKGYFCPDSLPELQKLIEKSDVVVVGPGIGKERDTFLFIQSLLKISKPLIIDADALNIIAESPDIYIKKDSNILTPHPGEMKRLLEAFELEMLNGRNRESKAKALAACLDATVVLKGARTVTAAPDGRITINASGCPALATAGSGDSL